MKGRRVYFDQFFACVALRSYRLMGNIVIRDQLQHKWLKLRLFSRRTLFFFSFFFKHTMTEALLNTALCYERDTDDLQYVGSEGTG